MGTVHHRIGVLTSGGEPPGMNAAIGAVVRSAESMGMECIGIRRGWNGLINGDIVRMDEDSVAHIINRGGTCLFTARSDEFRTKEGREKAYLTCKLLGIDGLVAIGGDGTFAGCLAFANEHDISVIGIPATIDNDIGCTHYSIGYDTAANTALDSIDKLRDTMQSHERCSVVEVMGHRAGNLALYVGLAAGSNRSPRAGRKMGFRKGRCRENPQSKAGRSHALYDCCCGRRDKCLSGC